MNAERAPAGAVRRAYGRADAAFTLPAGSPAELAGLVLHHAYVVLDVPSLQVQAVSAAVPLALVP